MYSSQDIVYLISFSLCRIAWIRTPVSRTKVQLFALTPRPVMKNYSSSPFNILAARSCLLLDVLYQEQLCCSAVTDSSSGLSRIDVLCFVDIWL